MTDFLLSAGCQAWPTQWMAGCFAYFVAYLSVNYAVSGLKCRGLMGNGGKFVFLCVGDVNRSLKNASYDTV
ncbi:MAG: hypothetical protein IPN42_01220 [Methylococcaceae bacterium]|nr:hypothetical protein [Methylococcaceae bacterium]